MTSIQAELGIIERDFTEQVSAASSSEELQQVKVAFLGKKGAVTLILKKLGSLPPETRPAAGQAVNSLRDRIEAVIEDKRARLDEIESEAAERSSMVYRRDSDPTHSPMFNQLEGLLVDRDISVADMKGCLETLMAAIFSRPLKARYRASYFPFTEPSIELDIECVECSGKNPACRICKGTGWLEVAGMGMVHPNVIRYGGIDPSIYNGFAWGIGLDRIAMLKYGLTDLRILFEGNVPYLLSGRSL